jgi:hypothetical protein
MTHMVSLNQMSRLGIWDTADYMLYDTNYSPGTASCGGGHILVQTQINEMTHMVSLNRMSHLGSSV